jgi:hypothetical protein
MILPGPHRRRNPGADVNDDTERGSVIALVVFVILMLTLITLTTFLSPNARW